MLSAFVEEGVGLAKLLLWNVVFELKKVVLVLVRLLVYMELSGGFIFIRMFRV